MCSDIVTKAIAQLRTDPQILTKPSSRFHCSGVLPYCVCGTLVYFLLGRTRSGKLLTFTGKSEVVNDGLFESPSLTAARELYEETLGAVLSFDQCLAATQACTEENVMVSTTPKNTLCYTFLICVPFKRHYSLNFNRTRDFLSFMNINECRLAEFYELKGICFDTLQKVRNSWEASGMHMSEDQWSKIRAVVPIIDEQPTNSLDWRVRYSPPRTGHEEFDDFDSN